MKKRVTSLLIFGVLAALLVLGTAGAQAPLDARVLVWESTPQDDGQLAVLMSDGGEEVLVDFSAGLYNNAAQRCGHEFWTPDGSGVVLFTGAAQGDIAIYPLAGGAPVMLGNTDRMACAGPMTFQFSSDGQRVGYISYALDALNREYPYGNLIVFEAATGASLATFDWTTAFALYDDGALMLRFYPDGKGNATEADLDWWDGAGRKTLVTIEPLYPPDNPDLECGMTSATVQRLGDTVYVLATQKCVTGTSIWRLVSVPMAGGSITEVAMGDPVGGYFPESFTTQLIPTQDGAGFLMTVPSGLSRNSVQFQWVTADGQVTPLLEGRHVIADRFGERLTEARHILRSMDGSVLAFVTTTGDQVQTLWTLDISTIGGEPIMIEEEGRNQRIFQYVWSSTNMLYYAAGSIESNSLHMLEPGGSPQRLARGRFFRLAVSYDGEKVAAAEWYANPESLGDDLFKLTVMDKNGTTFTMKEGGKEHNQMIPLAIQ